MQKQTSRKPGICVPDTAIGQRVSKLLGAVGRASNALPRCGLKSIPIGCDDRQTRRNAVTLSQPRPTYAAPFPFPNLLAPLLILLGGLCAACVQAQTQDVAASPNAFSVRSGDLVQFDVHYEASNGATGLMGLGVRLHWDSYAIAFVAFSDVFGAHKLGEDASCQDDSLVDYDHDPTTDCYAQVAWADIDAGWPGASAVKLFGVSLTSNVPDAATATIRFTASSSAPGYGLDATGAVVTGLPTISLGTLSVHLTGYGSIASLPEGIDCRAPCDEALGNCGVCVAEFELGEAVSLVADTVAKGVRPPIWSGCTPDAEGYSCAADIVGDSDVSVELEFCWECLPNPAGWRLLLTP